MGKLVAMGAPLFLTFFFVTAITASAQRFAAVSFDLTDGGNPSGSLAQGPDGYLYGTTLYGGPNPACENNIVGGCGTIFQLSSAGKLSTFYDFCSQPNCTDGETPAAGVTLGADGNFYGTTLGGGVYGVTYPKSGTVFKINRAGKLITLHSFCSQVNLDGVCSDGASPYGRLLQSVDGNFYGTTFAGGEGDKFNPLCFNSEGGLYGCGTVFKIATSGKLTTLYRFCPQLNLEGFCPDGQSPANNLVQATDGNLFGTTPFGGTNPCGGYGCGTIFRITPSGKFTTVYSFCSDQLSCTDGETPGALLQGADGNLYGTTTAGGPLGGGTVFRITPAGVLSTLYGFCDTSYGSSCPDGSLPLALIQANDLNFYGTTEYGGATCYINSSHGCGTLYRLTPGGVIMTLHSFCQGLCDDGSYGAGLLQVTDGALFGLAGDGGADRGCDLGCGAVFGVSAGLNPFVEANPNFGKAGQALTILGSHLAGTSSVLFNGTPATFTVVSSTAIKANVPTGATTGPIAVTTPSGTLNSNGVFRVLP